MFGSHYFFLEIYVILLKYPFVLKKLLYFILTTNYTMNSHFSDLSINLKQQAKYLIISQLKNNALIE